MKYSEALEFLFSQLPMYQRSGPAAYKNSLENIIMLDDLYGNPHQQFKTIHVAGTNGKGSVSHMLAAILQSAGYKTGLYTSPHLNDFRERIKIDGEMIGEEYVAKWISNFRDFNKKNKIEPSFFELTVIMAFDYFSTENVDIAVIEVGLGGRLDSTNIITPEVSIITNIGVDHTALLGDSPEKIAIEKAGIIKEGIPVIIGKSQSETDSIFRHESKRKHAPFFSADKEYIVNYYYTDKKGNQHLSVENQGKELYAGIKLDLSGFYQQENLPAVLKTVEILRDKDWSIRDEHIYSGFSHVKEITGLQGRWQIVDRDPLVVADTAHNADGIREVLRQIRQTEYNQLHIIFGMVSDKDTSSIIRLLPSDAKYYFTRAAIPRAMDEKKLAAFGEASGLKGKAYVSVKEALNSALQNAGKDDFIFVGGSTFVVAEILD